MTGSIEPLEYELTGALLCLLKEKLKDWKKVHRKHLIALNKIGLRDKCAKAGTALGFEIDGASIFLKTFQNFSCC